MARYSVNELVELIDGRLLQEVNAANNISNLLIDSRKVINGHQACFFALVGPNRDGHQHILEAYKKGVRCFVVSEVIDCTELEGAEIIEVENTLKALQILSKKHRDQFDFPVVAITGSNGKTIVKEWLSQILKTSLELVKSPKSFNSQVGVPLSIWQCSKQHKLGVFEAGISKPGEMVVLENLISPSIGVITNIGTAHDENFESRKQKLTEKFLLFKHCQHVIYCKDDVDIEKEAALLGPKIRLFSWSRNQLADLRVIHTEISNTETIITGVYQENSLTIQIPFVDAASIENAIHCWSVLLTLGYDNKFIKAGLAKLTSIAMRLELKEGVNNCSLINDYYNSDVVSLEIALDFVEHQHQHRNKTLVLSDILESGKEQEELYKEINELIVAKGITKLIGIGEKISAYASCFNLNKQFYRSTNAFLTQYDLNEFSDETILLKGARQFSFEKISKVLQKKIHNTVLEVNLSAIQHNLNYFKTKLKPKVRLMAMVKAHSYGAGAFEVSNLLQFNKIDYLGVAYADEGVALRKAGISTPIMVMNPDVNAYDLMIKHGLEPEIFTTHTLEMFEKALKSKQLNRAYPIHIKMDTGMHRLGFSIEDVPTLIDKVKRNEGLSVKSVFSHLATSDELQMIEHTQNQINSFIDIKKAFSGVFDEEPLFHILNSAGILTLADAQFDMVRLGLGLYGISSLPAYSKHLQAVSALKTNISQVRTLLKGDAIGYSRAGILTRNSCIATIPIGYADGMRRTLGNGKGHVLIKGKKAPIVGNVCMDMCMVDVTSIDTNEGDEVIVFGNGLPIEDFAKNMETIPYEALTGISPRVKRVYYQE
jgi:Alr-MurF fusion protein